MNEIHFCNYYILVRMIVINIFLALYQITSAICFKD